MRGRVRDQQRLRGCVLQAHHCGGEDQRERTSLLEDMEDFLEKLCPRDADYRHNDFNLRAVNMTENEPANGHAHLQHLVLGTSETIPVVDGVMQCGRWQSVFFIELDQ